MAQDDEPIPRADKGKGRATEPHQQEEPGIVDDLIAGWIGGAVGILASSLPSNLFHDLNIEHITIAKWY